jgi:transcription elongation factor Elf1
MIEKYNKYREICATALAELICSIQEEHEDLTTEECEEIVEDYITEISDIVGVYSCYEDAAYEVAHSMGLATSENERFFDFERFEEEVIRDSADYIELNSGRILSVVR